MRSKRKHADQNKENSKNQKSRNRTKKPSLALFADNNQLPLSGAGPSIGKEFVKAYFPQAGQTIRIASAYFRIQGHKIAQPYINAKVQIHILVGEEEGYNVREAVIDEISGSLGESATEIWVAVKDLVDRIKQNNFIIRDAREMETPFHAKFYICDNICYWHGSTNYSKRGLTVAAEQASVILDPDQIKPMIDWYDSVSQNARDLLDELLKRLEQWLDLAEPLDIYLKTLLLLSDLKGYPVDGDAHLPAYFQKGVIAQALDQIQSTGGALVIAATGLGKTVIGADIALRLCKESEIRRILLIAPQSVHDNWEKEFDGRRLGVNKFDVSTPFQPTSKISHHQISQLEQQLERANSNTLIIIDEAHFYRNQLLAERAKKSKSRVYQRFGSAIQAGAKILLLTATAYGTNMQNLNSLLRLLPYRNVDSLGLQTAWTADTPDTFADLPVVSILGLPHVIRMARERGDIDENGRVFIQIPGKRQYLPKSIQLKVVRYRLFLSAKLKKLFDQRYFNQHTKIPQERYDDDLGDYVKSTTDGVYNTSLRSWLSSPLEMKATIEKNIATPGKSDNETLQTELPLDFEDSSEKELEDQIENDLYASDKPSQPYKMLLFIPQKKRNAALSPLIEELERIIISGDDKFMQLKIIIDRHCISKNEKVIIFVGRLFTAIYVLDKLKTLFGQRLNIACTVELSNLMPHLRNVKNRIEMLRTFSPKSNGYESKKDYHVLICTDADGVGVNLQDANVLVHYDPPIGADMLFQRVGRILRMTEDPDRILNIYTFLPSLFDQESEHSQVLKDIHDIFNRIALRHDASQRILGSGVFSKDDHREIILDDEFDIVELARDGNFLKDVGGVGVESRLRHMAVLDQYYERALKLHDYLQSAKSSKQQKAQMFVLLRHEEKICSMIYNIKQRDIEDLRDFEILDRIACQEDEQRAIVPAEAVEYFANEAVRTWCKLNEIDIEHVEKICSMCLVPDGRSEIIATLFRDIPHLEQSL